MVQWQVFSGYSVSTCWYGRRMEHPRLLGASCIPFPCLLAYDVFTAYDSCGLWRIGKLHSEKCTFRGHKNCKIYVSPHLTELYPAQDL